MKRSNWSREFEFLINHENLGREKALELEEIGFSDRGGRFLAKTSIKHKWEDHPSVSEEDMPPPISNRPDHFNTEEPTDFDDAIDIIHFNAHWGKKEMRDEIVDPDWESKMQAEINRIVRESDEPYKAKPNSLSPEEIVSFEESNSTSS